MAGLILLWESGSSKEALKSQESSAASQTPALGSSREADLTLLAALTARDSAIKSKSLDPIQTLQIFYKKVFNFFKEWVSLVN